MSVCVPDTGANIEVKGAIIMSLKIVVRGVDIVIDRQHSTEANAISLAHTNSLPQCSCGYNCTTIWPKTSPLRGHNVLC